MAVGWAPTVSHELQCPSGRDTAEDSRARAANIGEDIVIRKELTRQTSVNLSSEKKDQASEGTQLNKDRKEQSVVHPPCHPQHWAPWTQRQLHCPPRLLGWATSGHAWLHSIPSHQSSTHWAMPSAFLVPCEGAAGL